jgi:hypothetical protein
VHYEFHPNTASHATSNVKMRFFLRFATLRMAVRRLRGTSSQKGNDWDGGCTRACHIACRNPSSFFCATLCRCRYQGRIYDEDELIDLHPYAMGDDAVVSVAVVSRVRLAAFSCVRRQTEIAILKVQLAHIASPFLLPLPPSSSSSFFPLLP